MTMKKKVLVWTLAAALLCLPAWGVAEGFTLPSSLQTIEEEAFAGLPAGTVVQMPENVASIGDGAFGEGVLLVTDAGSYAAGWANKHGVRWVEPPDQN